MNVVRRVTLSAAGFVMICFFLPWLQVSCLTLRDRASGFELARRDNQVLWLVPLFMLLILLTGLVRTIWEQRPAIFALISIVGGGLGAYLMHREHISNSQLPGIVTAQMTVWFWLGQLASLVIAVTGLLFYAIRSNRPP
jgi:hypothetical protein